MSGTLKATEDTVVNKTDTASTMFSQVTDIFQKNLNF